MTGARQMTLPLDYRPAAGRADFLVSDCNRDALAAVEGWRGWPRGALALAGPARAGKSHLVSVWCAETGAPALAAADLAGADPGGLAEGPCAVEDVPAIAGDRAGETALFHLVNRMAAEGRALLLTGRAAPADWGIALPDLASRLAATALARIGPPDDALLSALRVKLAADRGIEITPPAVAYCLGRMERSFAAAEALIARLDSAALARKVAVTRPLAAAILAEPHP